MEGLNSFIVLVGVFMCSLASNVDAYTFYAGGKDGWVLNPSESYGNWAERNRFQVNDNIVFRYKKGENSVLVVSKEGYDSCNVNNPKQKLDGGDSTFTFPSSGPFYFISGNQGYCNKGQKLVIVVLAVRGTTPKAPISSSPPTPSLASPPAPTTVPVPAASPSSTSESPAKSPVIAPTTAPIVAAPTVAPSMAPSVAVSPVSAPTTAPVIAAPTVAPSVAVSPVSAPTTEPVVAAPTVAPSIAPSVAVSPVSEPVSAPVSSTTSVGTPGPAADESAASFGVSLSSVAVGLAVVGVSCVFFN